MIRWCSLRYNYWRAEYAMLFEIYQSQGWVIFNWCEWRAAWCENTNFFGWRRLLSHPHVHLQTQSIARHCCKLRLICNPVSCTLKKKITRPHTHISMRHLKDIPVRMIPRLCLLSSICFFVRSCWTWYVAFFFFFLSSPEISFIILMHISDWWCTCNHHWKGRIEICWFRGGGYEGGCKCSSKPKFTRVWDCSCNLSCW